MITLKIGAVLYCLFDVVNIQLFFFSSVHLFSLPECTVSIPLLRRPLAVLTASNNSLFLGLMIHSHAPMAPMNRSRMVVQCMVVQCIVLGQFVFKPLLHLTTRILTLGLHLLWFGPVMLAVFQDGISLNCLNIFNGVFTAILKYAAAFSSLK